MVRLLMKHPMIHPFVVASGLDCSVLDIAPPRIVFVVDDDDPQCFQKARNKMTTEKYMQRFGKTAAATTMPGTAEYQYHEAEAEESQPTTAGAKGTDGGEARQQKSSKIPSSAEFSIDSIVMNPSKFDSLPQALLTYIFTDKITANMVWLWVCGVVIAFSILGCILCLMFLGSKRHDPLPPPRPQENAAEPAAPAN